MLIKPQAHAFRHGSPNTLTTQQSLYIINQANRCISCRRDFGRGQKGVEMGRAADNALESFVQKVKQHYPDARIYLFGSRAKGNHLLNSDYDIIIVSDFFSGIWFPKRMSNMLEYWDSKEDLEVLCYTCAEFEQKMKGINIVSEALKHSKIMA